MSESSYLDRPQDDGTAKSHPAFRRGQIAGTLTILRIVKAVAEGTDIGDGFVGLLKIEAARWFVLEMQNVLVDTASERQNHGMPVVKKRAQKALNHIAEHSKKINI